MQMLQLLLLIDAFLLSPAMGVLFAFFRVFYSSFFSNSLQIHRGYQIRGNSCCCAISLITDLNGSYKPCLFFRNEEIPYGGGWDSFRSPHSFDAFSMRSSHLRIAISFSL
jgi:hypothetical protein